VPACLWCTSPCSIEQRAAVILQLLRDRDAGVADAAAKLVTHWLAQECGGDPLQLLQLLDVETYTDAAVCAVESLVNTDSIQPPAGQHISNAAASGATAYIRAAAAAPAAAGSGVGCLPGLSQLAAAAAAGGRDKVQQLQPHQALMWWVLVVGAGWWLCGSSLSDHTTRLHATLTAAVVLLLRLLLRARRVMCEWLRTDAISKGLAAAATGGARAAVQAAGAAERHEVRASAHALLSAITCAHQLSCSPTTVGAAHTRLRLPAGAGAGTARVCRGADAAGDCAC
jgi:hypothetical protein